MPSSSRVDAQMLKDTSGMHLVSCSGDVTWVVPSQLRVQAEPHQQRTSWIPAWISANHSTTYDLAVTFKFGSWAYNGNELDLGLYGDVPRIDLSDFEDGWSAVENKGAQQKRGPECCPQANYPSIMFTLKLIRKYWSIMQVHFLMQWIIMHLITASLQYFLDLSG